MSNLSSFMISFCSCCILLGFLYMLCPSGSMQSAVKYVFCLCFVCCILSIVTGISKTGFDNVGFNTETELITEENAAVTAQIIFAKALNEQKINFRKITVDTNKLADGSITISRVTVYTDEPAEKITSAIGSDSYEVLITDE